MAAGVDDELLQGGQCYFSDDFEAARAHWETAFRMLRDAGELRRAARVAADLADLHKSALGNEAAARGWISRGRRLLDRVGRCPELGYLELAVIACDRPDVDEVERSAALALDLALEFGDSDLEVRALADSGMAMVSQGRVTDGFARLDEAMAALSAGEVANPGVAGKSFCAMVSACDRVGDVKRADEWVGLVSQVMTSQYGGVPRVLATHCQLAFGSVLCTAGRWTDAETALLGALGPSSSMLHRAETACRLAELRLLQGRVEEAAALVEPYEDRVAACLPLARLHLARGDCDLAAAVVKRGTRTLVGDRLRAGALLGVLVEAELARGDLAAAEAAALELDAVASETSAPALRAEAGLAIGRVAVAMGRHEDATSAFRHALGDLSGDDHPILCATIRVELAGAHAADGAAAEAVDEARAAMATFERVGAERGVDEAAALLRRLGSAGGGTRPRTRAAAGAIDSLSQRERDVLELLRAGLTNGEIGERLFISPKTAEHHVSRILTKLGVRSRAEAAAIATASVAG